MRLVDSHCHLDGASFAEDRAQVLERAAAAGVAAMLCIGTGDGPADLDCAIRLAEAHPQLFASVGVHPHDAAKWTGSTLEQMRLLLQHPKAVALGEIGLDYHYNFSPRPQQQDVFVQQLQLAVALRKPILIHTREAWADTFALLEQHWAPAGLPGVMHCFSGGPEEARRSLALGFSISFSGIVTYPKALEVQAACRETPEDRLLLETDSPYLAPVPHRGKRNEPGFVAHTARFVAALRGQSEESLADCTTANVLRLFPAMAAALPAA